MTRRAVFASRAVAAGSAVLLVAAMVSASETVRRHQIAAPPGPTVTEAANAATAVSLARAQGSRVEVLDQRTETRSVFAEPKGMMTAELTVRPVRVKRGGSWVAVDTTLERKAGGDVRPKAAAVELSFPGGGTTAPVVRYGHAGAWFELTWPAPLPAPVLAANSATYQEVLPGVDLVLRAEVDGFAQLLVVKDAPAARSPALAELRLGLRSEGLTLRATPEGALEAHDVAGAMVFAAPMSEMWDSSAPARRAVVGAAVDARSLVLRPDRGLLTDAATVFPVTIDPVWSTVPKDAWASFGSGKPNTVYWNDSPDPKHLAQVGQCNNINGDCNGIGEAYSYFNFDTRFLAGKSVLSSTFTAKVVHSPSSTVRDHQLFIAEYPIGPSTTWNTKPPPASWGGFLSTVSVPCAGRTGCVASADVNFWSGTAVRTDRVSTYFLKAKDSWDQYAWRKYEPSASKLTINYNTAPNTPTELSTDPPLAQPCRWCGGERYYGDALIRLRARLSDPDSDMVKARWNVYTNGALSDDEWGALKISGEIHDLPVNLSGVPDNAAIGWKVQASDDTDVGSWADGGAAFRVDLTPPSVRPTVSGLLYQEDNQWHGGVGVPDKFTFTSNGVGDTDHFLYGFQDPPSTLVDADALGGKASVTLTPPGDGPRDLFVQSVDRAGHRSPTRVFHFYVRAGNGPLAQWSFEGNTTDQAFLGDRDGTLSGAASYVPGAVGSALRFDPTGQMAAPNTVRTDTSFSVTAWVKPELAQSGQVMGAVSQDGDQQSGFFLSYRGDRWVFMMAHGDVANPQVTTAVAPDIPQMDAWTHLVGAYDRPANKIRIYVNGVLRAETALPANFAPWNAGGGLVVGREKWNGQTGNPWRGSIDEVQMYDRVLSPAEVAAMVSGDNVQVGQWKFDELGGTTAGNAIEGGEMAVLQNGASFTGDSNADGKPDGGAVGGALQLDGIDDYAASSGPVVRTDQSFTVSSWVKPDTAPSGVMTALSQDGNQASGFYLDYRGDLNNWTFMLVSGDGDNPNELRAVAPDVPLVGGWTHLTGVFDRPSNKIRLYVNGVLRAEAALPADFMPWHAGGALVLGQSKFNGLTGNRWRGLIDEVRVYSRVLSAAEIQGTVSRDDVAAGLWRLDGNGADTSGNNRNGTLNGGPAWIGGQTSVPDPTDLAMRLDGVDDYVGAPHLVDVRKSFSVSVWAKLDKIDGHRTVVSQDGSQISGFYLQATPSGQWAFKMHREDVVNGAYDNVLGPAVQVGVWTHLVAVHDAAAHRMSLYVNGVLAGQVDHTQTWDAAGGLQIGAARSSSSRVDFFPGAIDDVAVYSRVLFADEVRVMAGRDLSLVHNWALDEGSGTTTADSVGSRTGTLTGGVTRTPGRLGNAVTLDGVDGQISTTGVDLRTDASFTVSAWVNLARTCDPGAAWSCELVAVSVDGAGTSKFRLGHVADQDQLNPGVWLFEMPESNEPGAPVTKAAVSTLPSEVGTDTWVHLAGVYDKQANKLWLYVNGTRKGDGTLLTPWQATGGLQIGRGKDATGAPGQYWPGKVDEVRLYNGRLDDDRVSNLYHSYPALGGTPALPTANAGYWKFDENTGTTAADSSGRALTATLQGGAGWQAGGRNGHALWLNGTSAYAETAGAVLNTAQSFTVTAWAYRIAGGSNRTVVAQDGNSVSSFLLQYHAASDRWRVLVPSADQNNPTSVLLTSTEPAQLGQWTHLALAYDANLHQLRLYINGRLSAAQVGISILSSGGKLSIGRGKWNGGNVEYFPGGIDDVRAFGKALTDGEVAKVHDDVYAALYGLWRFDDGTVRDYSWRNNPTTASSGVSYTGGVSGQALQLDGVSSSATAQWVGADTRDSLTVSAWARLTRNDRVQTVVGQDGSRRSGFVLQYRPNLQRWVFAAPTQDADTAELVYAHSPQPAVLNEWVHLTGVYDYSGRQLRLYLNGQLAGSRNDVTLPSADGGFTIGRGKVNGQSADFFAGTLDEVSVEQGMATDDGIAGRAGWPAPPAGQLGRYVNAAGDRSTATTSNALPAGYHFDRSLGTLVAGGGPNTRMLYACLFGVDAFTSVDPNCEGKPKLADIGYVFTQPPVNLPVIPVYRCNSGSDHFESNTPGCDGATQESLLGYALAYATMARYNYPFMYDHWGTVHGTPPGYAYEGSHGYVSLTFEPGTQPLFSCRDGVDEFVSTDPNCEGKQILDNIGYLWTAAQPDGSSRPLYRCSVSVGAGIDRFTSNDPNCEGTTVDRQLGHVLTTMPTTAPTFPVNLALGKPATADSSCSLDQGPAKAVNGSWTGGPSDKWCSQGASKWWRLDLGSPVPVSSITLRHAGAGGEPTNSNTKDFTIQMSTDGSVWSTVVSVTGNTASTTRHTITPTTARYVRVNVQTPNQTADTAARIYEIEVYG